MRHMFLFSLILIFVFSGKALAQDEAKDGTTFIKREYKQSRKSNSGIEIKVDYPELVGEGANVKSFNQEVKSLVMRRVADAKKDFKSSNAEAGLSREQKEFYLLELNHSIEFANRDFIAIRFAFYQGAAVYNEDGLGVGVTEDIGRVFFFNYDLGEQKQLKLGDLFQPESKYLEVISEYVMKQRISEGIERENASVEVKPELRGFPRWAISKSGILLDLEFELQNYIEITPERTIAYNKFPKSLRSEVFNRVLASMETEEDLLPNICSWNEFDPSEKNANFRLGKITGRKDARAYFYQSDYRNFSGKPRRTKKYLISGDEIVVSRSYRGFVCAWFPVIKKVGTMGWIQSKKLKIRAINKEPSPADWFGNWEFGGRNRTAWLEIGAANGSNYLMIRGATFYSFKSKEDAAETGNIHFGTIGDERENGKGEVVKPFVNRFALTPEGYEGCKIFAQLVGKFLLVSDTGICGGTGVTYTGIYQQTHK